MASSLPAGVTSSDYRADGFFNTAAEGAIAVADSDPNVVCVGTGEVRSNRAWNRK